MNFLNIKKNIETFFLIYFDFNKKKFLISYNLSKNNHFKKIKNGGLFLNQE